MDFLRARVLGSELFFCALIYSWASRLAMDWEKLIPGHPGPGDRLGTKQDAQNILTLMQEASAEIKKQAQEGKCWEPVEKEFKLPKYEKWPGYENNLPFVVRRYCGIWGRGT